MEIKVLDSSAIIHDPDCFKKFGHSLVCIPITVIEELDNIKHKTGEASAAARRFIKSLDGFSTNQLVNSMPGIPIGDSFISIVFCNGDEAKSYGCDTLQFSKADNQILSTCIRLRSLYPIYKISLITEDRNLRLKSRFIGIESCGVPETFTDKSSGIECKEGLPEHLIRELYESSTGINANVACIEPRENKYCILKNGSISALAKCKGTDLVRVIKKDACNISSKNVEQTFALDALFDAEISLVALTGNAGTGKTLITLAAALEQRKYFRKILLSRPIIPLGPDPGCLPGDINEKIRPFMQPFFDNLSVLRHVHKDGCDKQPFDRLIEDEKLVIEPLAYIRGRSFARVFLIIDEAQNLTPLEIKTIVTRAGEGTKVVFTGDINQIDNPHIDKDSNGLSYLIKRMSGQKIFNHVELIKGERSELARVASELL